MGECTRYKNGSSATLNQVHPTACEMEGAKISGLDQSWVIVSKFHLRSSHARGRKRFSILFIYLLFISNWHTANEITIYNKSSYICIHSNWSQLSNIGKMKIEN